MKKTKLVVGILLMILGIGMSVGSVVLHSYEHGRYGMNNARYRMANGHGVMGGYGFRSPNQRRFNRNPNPNQGPNKGPNQNPNQGPNQNQGPSRNGGVNK